MIYNFITGNYDKDHINIYAREENGEKKKFEILGFKPYFFVPDKDYIPHNNNTVNVEDSDVVSIYGEKLKKITMRTPTDVRDFREKFVKHYEADIRFVRRFLIDTGIKNYFRILRDRETIHYTDLVPEESNKEYTPIVCFIDIEVKYSGRFPNPKHAQNEIICVTVYDTDNRKYLTVVMEDIKRKEKIKEDEFVLRVKKEVDIIRLLKDIIEKINPDVLTGWNVNFDIEYLITRAKKYGIYIGFDGICIHDLLSSYRRLYKKGSNRLKDVVIEEGITQDVVSKEYHKEWFERDKEKLIEYNRADVKYCVQLDEKYKLISFFWRLKTFIGLESMGDTLYHGVLIDTILLRKYSGKKILPSKIAREDEETYEGAFVLSPPRGLFENVTVFDMSRYYPNIIVALGLSPNNDGVVPDVCLELMEERERYDKILAEMTINTPEYEVIKGKQTTVKYLLNAVYGYFGSPSSRLFMKEIASKVTEVGREGLLFIRQQAEEKNYKVLYADTDSIFIQSNLEELDSLERWLNSELERFCEEKGIKRRLTLKCDKFFSRVLFTGVKKRYAGLVSYEGGKKVDYTHITGFEFVRRDASKLTRALQKDVFDMILRGNTGDIINRIREVEKKIRNKETPLMDIAIPKTLGKNLRDYGKGKGGGIPDYVRGAIYSAKNFKLNIRAGDMVRMLYVKRVPGYPPTNVVCFLDEGNLPKDLVIDYEKNIDRTVKMKVEDLLGLVNISWGHVKGDTKITKIRGLSECFL
ncbi:DNA-directed DNA polymerase [Patescibacteria group bacterium]|nr:DNA-directed DNA polymerase [Patescibacteria group bacterium]